MTKYLKNLLRSTKKKLQISCPAQTQWNKNASINFPDTHPAESARFSKQDELLSGETPRIHYSHRNMKFSSLIQPAYGVVLLFLIAGIQITNFDTFSSLHSAHFSFSAFGCSMEVDAYEKNLAKNNFVV